MDDEAESAVGSQVSTWEPFSSLCCQLRVGIRRGRSLKGVVQFCLKGYS